MSYSLAVVDGDLAPLGGQLQIVSGVAKLKQDIDLWIRERFGIDRFHPRYGSILEDFIGGIVEDDTSVEVTEELMRVLRNYMAVQKFAFTNAPQAFSLSELLLDVASIKTNVSYDTVTSMVTVVNGERAPVTTTTTTSTVSG